MMHRNHFKPHKDHPELSALLERAAKHVMTPAEIAAQRRSWCVGEMMLDHPEMTKEQANKLHDEALRSLGYGA
jgi:hypothetical protein